MSLKHYLTAALLGAGLCVSMQAVADDVAIRTDPAEGMRIFKSANCVGCHKWTGAGGGGYGGAAANLRQTHLDRDQIIETILCGRPMTGMPHFKPEAYADGGCYGIKQADLTPEQMPPEPGRFLRPEEVGKVADFVITQIKGHGDPTYAECQAFFGTGSQVCNSYRVAGDAPKATDDAAHTGDAPAAGRHLAIESAPDVNAPKAQ